MLQYRPCLIDNVLHIGARLVELLVGEQLFYPARIEVEKVTGTAAHVGKVLDGKAEAPWTGRPHHQPVVVAWEMLVADLLAEFAVIDFVIVPADPLLGHAGGAASFEDIKRAAFVFRGDPNLGLKVAKPLLLEVRKASDDFVERADFRRRIPAGFLRPIEPEWATSFGREMPANDFARVSVELFLRLFGSGW